MLDFLHFTPKTYDIIIYIKDLLKMPYVYHKKLVPSMSWEVIEFFIFLYEAC